MTDSLFKQKKLKSPMGKMLSGKNDARERILTSNEARNEEMSYKKSREIRLYFQRFLIFFLFSFSSMMNRKIKTWEIHILEYLHDSINVGYKRPEEECIYSLTQVSLFYLLIISILITQYILLFKKRKIMTLTTLFPLREKNL